MDWPKVAERIAGGEDTRTEFAHGRADISSVGQAPSAFLAPDQGAVALNAIAHRDHTRSGLIGFFNVFCPCAGTTRPAALPDHLALQAVTAGGGLRPRSGTRPPEAVADQGILIMPVLSRAEPEPSGTRHTRARASLPLHPPGRVPPMASHS